MRMVCSLVAVVSLVGTVVLIPIYGGVLFAFFVFGAFLLALVGAIGRCQGNTGSRGSRTPGSGSAVLAGSACPATLTRDG